MKDAMRLFLCEIKDGNVDLRFTVETVHLEQVHKYKTVVSQWIENALPAVTG
jgi:hypothetical protein